jgi:hypothetical protein
MLFTQCALGGEHVFNIQNYNVAIIDQCSIVWQNSNPLIVTDGTLSNRLTFSNNNVMVNTTQPTSLISNINPNAVIIVSDNTFSGTVTDPFTFVDSVTTKFGAHSIAGNTFQLNGSTGPYYVSPSTAGDGVSTITFANNYHQLAPSAPTGAIALHYSDRDVDGTLRSNGGSSSRLITVPATTLCVVQPDDHTIVITGNPTGPAVIVIPEDPSDAGRMLWFRFVDATGNQAPHLISQITFKPELITAEFTTPAVYTLVLQKGTFDGLWHVIMAV